MPTEIAAGIDETWNPTVGCTRVSPGCENCYAEKMAARLAGMGRREYKGLLTGRAAKTSHWSGTVNLLPDRLSQPLHWRKPRRVFVDSMSDLFHESVPFEYIAAVFGIMSCTEHTYQILTKRPERARAWFDWIAGKASKGFDSRVSRCRAEALSRLGEPPRRPFGRPGSWDLSGSHRWPLPKVWLGVSVEDQKRADERIPLLLETPAAVRFLSCEPLISPVDLRAYLHDRRRDHVSIADRNGLVQHGHTGPDLAAREIQRDSSDLAADTKARRNERVESRWLPQSHVQGGRDSDEGRSASHHLDDSQQARDSVSLGDQPQEREEVGQSTGQSRSRDEINERQARDSRAGGQPTEGAARRRQRAVEDHGRGRSHDPTDGRGEGDVATRDRRPLRSDPKRGIGDRQTEKLGSCDLVIVGGESGPGARPCNVEWIRSIVRQCKEAGVPCFVKQLGAKPYGTPASVSRALDLKSRKGSDPSEWPEDLRVQEYPS